MAAAVPVRVTLAVPLVPTVLPPGVPTVMVPWLTDSVVVRMSVVLGLSATETAASEMAAFSAPLSVAGTVSVTAVELVSEMAAVWVPVLAPLVVSVVVTARLSLPK